MPNAYAPAWENWDSTSITTGSITSNSFSTSTVATTVASTDWWQPVRTRQASRNSYHYGYNTSALTLGNYGYDDGGQAKSNRDPVAKERACKLLREKLTPRQRADFDRHKRFEVVGRSGKRYRLTCKRVGNIDEIDDNGQVMIRYCVHPADFVPDEDTLVAQKLWLENADEELLAGANVHYRSRYAA